MLKLIAALVLLAGFAATAPVIAIPSGPPPPKEQHAAIKQGIGNAASELAPGASKQSPLYVKAECEQGCGHSEDEGWLNRLQNDPNAWFAGAVAFFTFLTLLVLVSQRNAAHAANQHHRVTERAYMVLSHKTGLQIDGQVMNITMQIRNWGRTPGTVTDNILGPIFLPKGGKMPREPDYELLRTETPEAFLAPEGKIEWPQSFEVESPDLAKIATGDIQLFLLGYVDYRDQFGGRYRAGYAREYIPGPGNNLGFVRALPRYNYDRARKPGEGCDWTEPDVS